MRSIVSATSFERYTFLLNLMPRERVPLDWAGTHNNLGNALSTLGGRESTARLEEAVAALSRRAEERTRDCVPLDWGATQDVSSCLHAYGVTFVWDARTTLKRAFCSSVNVL